MALAERHDPQHLGGTIFREPIICKNVPRLVPPDRSRSSSAATPMATSIARPTSSSPGKGTLSMKFAGEDGKGIERRCSSAGSGVVLATYNLDNSIRDFARASMNYGLNRNYPVYLSTKNTILKQYDGRFMELFQEVFDKEFKDKFAEKKLYLRAPADRRHGGGGAEWSGGYVWACKNYDGDVQSDTVAQGFGLLN